MHGLLQGAAVKTEQGVSPADYIEMGGIQKNKFFTIMWAIDDLSLGGAVVIAAFGIQRAIMGGVHLEVREMKTVIALRHEIRRRMRFEFIAPDAVIFQKGSKMRLIETVFSQSPGKALTAELPLLARILFPFV